MAMATAVTMAGVAAAVTADAAEVTTVVGLGKWLIVAEADELATVDNVALVWLVGLESVLGSPFFLWMYADDSVATVPNTEVDEGVTNAFGNTDRLRVGLCSVERGNKFVQLVGPGIAS